MVGGGRDGGGSSVRGFLSSPILNVMAFSFVDAIQIIVGMRKVVQDHRAARRRGGNGDVAVVEEVGPQTVLPFFDVLNFVQIHHLFVVLDENAFFQIDDAVVSEDDDAQIMLKQPKEKSMMRDGHE